MTARIAVGVILAGGQSRRMGGGDKALRALAGRPMLRHVVDRFRPQVGALLLNANGDPARFSAFDLPVVPDASAEYEGPLAGILAAMMWATCNSAGAHYLATVPADMPFLPTDLVARLSNALRKSGTVAAIAASGGRSHPVAGLWSLTLATSLASALGQGNRKLLAFADRHGAVRVAFAPAELRCQRVDPFFNVNTPGEFAEAEALLTG